MSLLCCGKAVLRVSRVHPSRTVGAPFGLTLAVTVTVLESAVALTHETLGVPGVPDPLQG
jgi:hypothetical protein